MTERVIHRKRTIQQPTGASMLEVLRGLAPVVILPIAILAWAYWATLTDLIKEWQRNDDYSAGQLVPLVAVFFLWVDRKKFARLRPKPCWLGGLAVLLVAQAARMYGILFLFESAERYSLVLTVAGLVLMIGGTRVFWQAKWILLFLFLMVPLPGRIHNLISSPLQSFASSGSVFVLEAIGVRVSQQGNVVTLDQRIPMAVAEACSGLRMLTAFVIVAGFVAYMVKRPPWQKAALVISSIPVAVLCNVLRLVATAILFLHASTETAEKFFHDFAGLVMMPAAVMLMFAELWIMSILTLPDSDDDAKYVKRRGNG